jgi:hypothetical protein
MIDLKAYENAASLSQSSIVSLIQVSMDQKPTEKSILFDAGITDPTP